MKDINETIHAILYIDLLGTTHRIQSGKSVNSLSSVQNIFYQFTQELLRQGVDLTQIKMQAFSDNVLMAKSVEDAPDSRASGLNQMIYIAALFQLFSLLNGWLIRGGITVGNLYLDDILVWGNGLIRAYEIESKYAIFPRIVIDKKQLDKLMPQYSANIIGWTMDNGFPIVDFLNCIHGAEIQIQHLNSSLKKIIDEADGIESVISKIEWMKHYYREWCQKKGLSCIIW